MNTIEIRQHFHNFFRANNHTYLKPSKVFLEDDPSLLFVNAGMNQLKDIFLNKRTTPKQKLMNSQICIRAGGKHNDLDDVGSDSYHLTSFEMLGSWSLGSYGKEETIQLALKFLESCGLNKNYIYVTYFEGYENLPIDIDTMQIWSKYIDEGRIIKGSFKDNFWFMDNNGPCGPCTEIHYDLLCRDNNEGAKLVNKDDPFVVEIWNMVFMSYNKVDNNYFDLDKLYVDTGLGLERLAMILQKKYSIYEIDIFRKLISYGQIIISGEYYSNTYSSDNSNYNIDKTYRIFADHIRTIIIALYQGANFGQNGKEFVLKKIFRRILNNIYINSNLLNETRLITQHNCFKSLIIEVLNFYLIKKNIDDEMILNKLTTEEKYYKSTLQTTLIKYKKYCNKYKDIIIARERMREELGIDKSILELITNKY